VTVLAVSMVPRERGGQTVSTKRQIPCLRGLPGKPDYWATMMTLYLSVVKEAGKSQVLVMHYFCWMSRRNPSVLSSIRPGTCLGKGTNWVV